MDTTETFKVCVDCHLALACDCYDNIESDERVREVEAGFRRLARNGYVMTGSEENGSDFSRCPCECCGTTLAGSRHEMIHVLTKKAAAERCFS